MSPSTLAATGSSGTAPIDPGVSRQTVAAVPKVCRALAEPLVVSGDCRVVRTLDLRQHEPAIDHQAERRSEEHTSELQSLMRISYAVFCLKKKNKILQQTIAQPRNLHTQN